MSLLLAFDTSTADVRQLRGQAIVQEEDVDVGHHLLRKIQIIMYFVSAVLLFFVIHKLYEKYRRGREEEARQERERALQKAQDSAVENALIRRKQLVDRFTKNQLQQTLTAEDFGIRQSVGCGASQEQSEDQQKEDPVEESQHTITEECIEQGYDGRDESGQASSTSAVTASEQQGLSSELREVSLKRNGEDVLISIQCSICLEQYEAGSCIVWSANPLCKHAFHHECILDYLVRQEETDEAPCPCCRQVFLPIAQTED